MLGEIERQMAKIRVRLEQIPPQLRACFAVSCATRLERAFADFARLNDPNAGQLYSSLLDTLWTAVRIDRWERTNIEKAYASARGLCEVGEYPWDDGVTPHAEDAAAALTYAFAALLSGAVQDAVWASQRGLESVLYYVESIGLGPESSPLVAREADRQLADLESLARIGRESRADPSAFDELRDRARQDALRLFDPEALPGTE